MCIVSFYKQENKIILTHNRDELKTRKSSSVIEMRNLFGVEYQSPVDLEKNGTWIFSSSKYVACILNGGKEKPVVIKNKYRKSRGLVLLDLLGYKDVLSFCKMYNFKDIAPFTIVVYELETNKCYLIFWNESCLDYSVQKNTDFFVRCSTTLYSQKKIIELEKIFPKFKEINQQEILNIHKQLQLDDTILGNEKATTSITQVVIENMDINMKYCLL